MRRLKTLWHSFLSTWGRPGVKREMDEELRFPIQPRTAENTAAGVAPEKAAREACHRCGNARSSREEYRDARGAGVGEDLRGDLRFGFRMLAKSPGFAAVATLMLALGIGSATAMYSVVRAIVLQPCSSPQSDRLVYLWSNVDQPLATPDYFDLCDQAASFAELGAYTPQTFNVGGEHPVCVRGVSCTPGVLRAFGVAPALGRWLEPADEQKGAPPVAVISHRLFQESFDGDPRLVGRSIRLDGREVTVVGVMPPRFEFCSPWMDASRCEIWRSFQLERDQGAQWNSCTVGCLKKGVTLAAANAEIKALGARFKAARLDAQAKSAFRVTSLRFEVTRYAGSYVWMIFGATLLVLVVACTNVASMLLARCARRQGEFGVRLGLGATRGRIFRLVLSEGLWLALAGTLVGAGLAAVELRYLKSLVPLPEARSAAMVLDRHAFAFAAGLTWVAAGLASFPAAWAAVRVSVADLLRSDSRAAVGSGPHPRLLRGLMVTQVAVAFILANVAVLFSASYAKMIAANATIVTERVLSAELDLHGARYETNGALPRFCDQLTERVAALPGVAAAAVTTDLPLEWGPSGNYLANDEVFDPAVARPAVVTSAIAPGYFAAADIPLLRGRTLRPSDAGWGDIGVVVNRALAAKYWPGQDPLGKIIRPNAAKAYFHGQVVGVVESVRQWGVKSEPQPQIYWTVDHAWGNTIFLIVRSPRPAAALAPDLRRAVAELDPDLPLSRIRTFKAIVREATLADRMVAMLTDYCMVLAMALVAIGLYGTLSYHVLRRTREIGVRMALGAGRRDVARLIFRQGLGWVLLGISIGIGGALAAARTLRTLVYDLNPLNPLSLVVAAAAVILAATLACWLPARRAAKVDPMEALRSD